MNDHEIVEALRNRAVSGLTGLYDAHAAPLYAYCWSLLGDEGAAQQALGETFIVAEAHIEKLADPARLRVWLYAIARNECIRQVAGSPDRAVTALPAEAAVDPRPPSRAVALDELLSGGAPARPAGDAGSPGVPGMMVAPGVLGVPERPSAPADMANEPDPTPAGSEPDATTDDPDAEAATPAIGIASALGAGGGSRDTAPPAGPQPAGPSAEHTDPTHAVPPGADASRQLVERVLAAVPPAEGEMLDLAYRHGFGAADIGTVVGLAAHQVHSMLAHADQQVRSGLAVERLASGGRIGPPDLAARMEGGEPPAAALLLSVRPPPLPHELKTSIIDNFTAPEKIGNRLYVGRRAMPLDKAGFPVPLDRVGAAERGQPEDGESSARGWRWPAAGAGVAACLAATLAAVLLWPSGGSERATNVAVPGTQSPSSPAAPPPSIDVSVTTSPTTPSAAPTASAPTGPSPAPWVGRQTRNPGGDQGGERRSGPAPGKPRPTRPTGPPSTVEPGPTTTFPQPDPTTPGPDPTMTPEPEPG